MTPTRRELLGFGCAAIPAMLFDLPSFAQQPVSGSPSAATIDPISLVNPELRAPLQQMLKQLSNFPPLSAATLKESRQAMGGFGGELLPAPEVHERMIPGSPGTPDVRVFITGATANASKPGVLHIHGGGYITGSGASSRRDMQDLVLEHDCVAITVDYRLAPETIFPGALEDNYAALRWVFTHAKELGIDTKRIAIKGESAGGGHAAALAIAARDRGEFPLCLQVLIYPMLDDRTGSSVQPPPFIGRYLWTPEMNRFGWTSLLGVPAGSGVVPKNSVPARVQNLAGLPPTFIGVGSIDLFVEEDLAFGARLIASGVSTEMNIVPGAFHGFDHFGATQIARDFKQAWNDAIRRAFKPLST